MLGYRYKIKPMGVSSNVKYGNCEVCGKPVPEVFYQIESRKIFTEEKGEGWTYNNCHSYFGHQECLNNKRR